MESTITAVGQQVSRRSFLKGAMFGAGGLALYAGVFERHWLEIVHTDVAISGLPAAFDGMRVAQLSDIHLDEFTEPFLLRESIDEINREKPDMVLLTGDYVSAEVLPRNLTVQIFRVLLENAASFYGSQMTAMDSASRNAGEVIKKLTLQMNRSRQASITKELIEIISGAEAL